LNLKASAAKQLAVSGFDLLVLSIILLSAAIGWFRGGLREAVTLAAIAGGFLFLNLFGASAAGLADGIIGRLIGLLLVFLAGDILVSLLGAYLVRRFAGRDVRRNDRLAGGLFGTVRGWVLAAAILYTALAYYDGAPLPGWATKSLFAPALEATVDLLLRKAEFSVTELSKAAF
jgi:membrane protein required for colicin V production